MIGLSPNESDTASPSNNLDLIALEVQIAVNFVILQNNHQLKQIRKKITLAKN